MKDIPTQFLFQREAGRSMKTKHWLEWRSVIIRTVAVNSKSVVSVSFKYIKLGHISVKVSNELDGCLLAFDNLLAASNIILNIACRLFGVGWHQFCCCLFVSYEELYSIVQNKMAAARKYVAIAEWTMQVAYSKVQMKCTFFHKSRVLKRLRVSPGSRSPPRTSPSHAGGYNPRAH